MFPPGAFGVGVTVAAAAPVRARRLGAAGRRGPRPSRLGELLPVERMTAEQKAANLELVAEAEAQLAAFKAELVAGLATDRPARDDRQRGEVGAASGEWAAQLLDEGVSEFFPDELALILNCSRAAATQLWERSRRCCSGCRRPGPRWRTGGWTGRERGRSPRSWAGRPVSLRTTCLRRSRRWCCRRPPGCRSPGSGPWCAGS